MAKTGTTFLQSKVFPELDRLGILNYHNDPSQIKDLLTRHEVLNEKNQKKFDFGLDNFSDDSIHLISFEGLLSCDPRNWKTSLSNLLIYFGKESEILITLRDPYSFLRSLYQQMIHQGESDLSPELYFLRLDLYEKHRDYFGRSNSTRRFSVDELDYSYLFNLFSKHFDRIYFSDMKTTMEYKFLVDMNIIDKSLLMKLKKEKLTTPSNKSYSKKAMLLDIKRYKILSALKLMPFSSSIRERNNAEKLIFDSCGLSNKSTYLKSNISRNVVRKLLENFKNFIKHFRTISKILKLPYTFLTNWRLYLQDYVNVLFKYEQFQLPAATYLGKHFEDNVDFYKKLPLRKGYKK